jgi:hypothetical protein
MCRLFLSYHPSQKFSKSKAIHCCRNMYGPPPNCKKKLGATRTVCENVSGLLVEIELRALDEDAHVPVL